MAKTLTAGPISDPSDSTLFIPGPAAYPPLYPAQFVDRTLTATAVVSLSGTYPGADTYPGSDDYPGRGSDLVPSAATPKTLTGVPA